MNNEARESSQDLLVGNDGNTLYAWRDKNGEVHDTKEINWEANWPPCVSCQEPAFISTHATKAKCLYYYNVKPGPNTHVCGKCLARYNEEDKFNFHDDIFICKDHFHCLLFTSKKAKNRFDNSEDDMEDFKELKQSQGYFNEKPPSFEEVEGEWITNEDIFNKAVEEARFLAPEHINNNPQLIEATKRYDTFQQELREAENNNDVTKEVLEQYKQMLEETTKERDHWKRQYEVIFA